MGGAEWTPPADEVHLYESMFAAASAGGAVPGTVSGRAAVQFFTRSGLPKDVLKAVSRSGRSATSVVCAAKTVFFV